MVIIFKDKTIENIVNYCRFSQMKCPKCKNKDLLVMEAQRSSYDILTCSGSTSKSFAVLRRFRCKECLYEWEKS